MTNSQIGQLVLAAAAMGSIVWRMTYAWRQTQEGKRAVRGYVEMPPGCGELPNDEFVTVAHLEGSYLAEMARLRLESAGIQCVILGQPSGGSGRSLLMGPGVEIKVRAADAPRAVEALRDVTEEASNGPG